MSPAEGGDCLSQWRRPRCHRRLPSRRGDGCSLLYPPEVRLHGPSSSAEDLLTCSELWSPCPALRKAGGQSACDPLTTNGKGCQGALDSPCVFMRTCHHVSNQWNIIMNTPIFPIIKYYHIFTTSRISVRKLVSQSLVNIQLIYFSFILLIGNIYKKQN